MPKVYVNYFILEGRKRKKKKRVNTVRKKVKKPIKKRTDPLENLKKPPKVQVRIGGRPVISAITNSFEGSGVRNIGRVSRRV